jgi:uncharacterized membrane protein
MKIQYIILIIVLILALLHILFETIHIILIKYQKNKLMIKNDYWVWGIIYFNPDDKRIFVPKKFQWLGWTFNFANPLSYIIMIVVIFVCVISAFLK